VHGDVLIIDGDARRLARCERLEAGLLIQRAPTVDEGVRHAGRTSFWMIVVVLEALSAKEMECLPELGARAPVFTFGRSPSIWPFGWSPRAHYPRVFEFDAFEAWVTASLGRVAAEQRAAQFERQLLHAERLVAVGQLAAGVAHEVNNPAAFVTTNLCLLDDHRTRLENAYHGLHTLMEEDPVEGWRTWLSEQASDFEGVLEESQDIIRENLEGMSRVSSIVRDLKNFSRIERSSIELVHPNQIVNAACNLVQNQIRHKARLIRDAGEVPALNADRNKLTQVVTNLLLNAAHAIPDGEGEEHRVRIRTWHENQQVHIEVSDTGRGIPPALQEKIFEPFFTTKKRDKGTGLGLALCADIVRQHKGAIEVQSRRGLGACFSIGLPVNNGLEPSRVESAAPTRSEPASGVRSGRLLFVDDELMLIRAYKRSLAKHYDVVFAEGGQEALDVLAKDDDFDLVVCDLMMPQVDGIRVFEHARQRHPHLVERFLFCSGGAFTPRAREFIATSGNRLLEKPLSPRELDAGIQQALAQVSGTMDAPNLDDELPPFEEGASATRSLS